MQEQGHSLKLIEGRYKGRTLGATISGEFVAVISPESLNITWDYLKIRSSVLGATEAQVNSMLASVTPTG